MQCRSHQHGGGKLLRCFPHCCPDHVTRFTCGSSLHLLVIFSGDATALRKSGELLVCSRFEPVAIRNSGSATRNQTSTFKVGDKLTLPAAAQQSIHVETASGNWFVAKPESNNAQLQEKLPKNTILFVFHNNSRPRWFYKTKAALEHQLIAYVLQTQGSTVAEELQGCRLGCVQDLVTTVVCRHPSPRFKIKARQRSRRQGSAGSLARRDRIILAATDADDQVGQAKAGTMPQIVTALSPEVSSKTVKRRAAVDAALDSLTIGQSGCSSLLDRRTLEPALDDKVLHLIIVPLFLDFAPVSALAFCFDDVSVRECSGSTKILVSVLTSFQRQVADKFCSRDEWLQPDDHQVRQSFTLLLDALASPVIWRLFTSTFSIDGVEETTGPADVKIPTKEQIQQRFAQFTERLYDSITLLLQVQTPRGSSPATLAGLASDLLRIVYRCEDFHLQKTSLSKLLLGRSEQVITRVYRAFSAQLREAYTTHFKGVGKEQRAQPELSSSWRSEERFFGENYGWTCQWILNTDGVRVISHGCDAMRGISSWVFRTQVLSAIDIRMSTTFDPATGRHCDSCSLRTLSFIQATATRGAKTAAMDLVLDGRLRVFRVLPSGLSSLAASIGGEWDIGDYVGAFVSSDKTELELQLFAFRHGTTSDTGRDYRSIERGNTQASRVDVLRLRLRLRMHGRCHALFVHGEIQESSLSCSAVSLQKISSSTRAARLAAAYWVPVMELHAYYQPVAQV